MINVRCIAAAIVLVIVGGKVAITSAPSFAQTPAPPKTVAPAGAPTPGAATIPGPAQGARMPSPTSAMVYIGWPTDGMLIRTATFKVWFGTRNFGVAPAGTSVPNTGHHHLLIDTDLPPLDQPIPNDKQHLHFGHGQTETTLELAPGRHTLQLLMADGNHVPHNPPLYSKRIVIYVRAP